MKGDTRSVRGWFYGLPLGLLSAKSSFLGDIVLVGMGDVFVGEEVMCMVSLLSMHMTRTINIIY